MYLRVLSKADLCRIFGLYSLKSGRTYPKKLRSVYFTDAALESLNIPFERYQSVVGLATFTYPESQRIIEYFKIEACELEQAC